MALIEFSNRFHRHKNLENALLEQSKEISDLKLQLASIYGKIAVKARETKKERKLDAEIETIKKQIAGEVIGVFDKDGNLVTEDE